MPFKILDLTDHTSAILDKIEYIKNENVFKISDSKENYIKINYIPDFFSEWDENRYELYVFENHYLNAEIDIFQIYESSLKNDRLGYIFPLGLLEANEINYNEDEYPHLKNYITIAYKKILQSDLSIQNSDFNKIYNLSDLFKDYIVCLLNKDSLAKIKTGFNIKDYILSFYGYGYLEYKNHLKNKSIFDKSDFVKEMRLNRKRITIKKSNYDINGNDFIRSLFRDHLLQSDSHIVRFILLYQVLEHFIEDEFNREFELQLDNYKKGSLSKNDLKENISKISRERDLIRTVINRISITNNIQIEFARECDFLFQELNLEFKKKTFTDNIYDLRNLITHRLRLLTSKNETLVKIIEIFERIIVEILINYTNIEVSGDNLN